jgi:spermidine synthase
MIRSARLLSFLTGFLSLSQEILWVRFAGFCYHGAPQAFGMILGLYLLGIAVGAGIGKMYCRSEKNLFRVAGILLFTAALLDAVFPFLATEAFALGNGMGTAVLFTCVVITSLIKSKIFPIAHHLGSTASGGKVGSSVSKVYFANIAGSTLGPLVTGFMLLQILTLQQCFMLMAGLTLLTGAYCWQVAAAPARRLVLAGSAAVVILLLSLPGVLLPRLVASTPMGGFKGTFKSAVENRYGIIHLLDSPDGEVTVFGGNAYDGTVNIDFMRDSNWISRLYALAAVKPHPARVLVIGMSAGSWTRVLSSFPGVERIDVVEINPGYKEIISQYSAVQPLLDDPRVHMHFDDGRRWLKRHPEETYDLLVMNTTFHWRAYSTMLLSREFLSLMRQHMNPGAVLAYNSTFSRDVFQTASVVFPEVYTFGNFAIAGEKLTVPPEEEAIARIAALTLDGRQLVDTSRPEVLERVREKIRIFKPFATAEDEVENRIGGEDKDTRPLEVITDQNMLTEYRYGQSIFR